jgi:hypothetical protein
VAVSPQKPDGSLSIAEKNDVTYPVVSDPGNQIAKQLGIVFTLGDQARDAQTKLRLDLTQANIDGTADLPLTTAVLVDATGTIRWIDVRPDYTTRTEPAEILAATARFGNARLARYCPAGDVHVTEIRCLWYGSLRTAMVSMILPVRRKPTIRSRCRDHPRVRPVACPSAA